MSSIFFQISRTDFLEASKAYGNYKEYAIRIISYATGQESYVYLPEVSLNELSILASILRLKLLSGIASIDMLRNYVFGRSYYY